jgi:GT2 family glycosyltransferase
MITVIPYKPDNLGAAYNEVMEKAADWVLFLDHDILTLNPNWYKICMNAIKNLGHKAGFISCLTNRIGCHWQKATNYDIGVDLDNDDIEYHIKKAKEIDQKHHGQIYEPGPHGPLSGFFILTHKQAWKDAGGFKDGFLTVDNDYDEKIKAAGYKRYILKDLYYYHVYTKKGLWNEC